MHPQVDDLRSLTDEHWAEMFRLIPSIEVLIVNVPDGEDDHTKLLRCILELTCREATLRELHRKGLV